MPDADENVLIAPVGQKCLVSILMTYHTGTALRISNRGFLHFSFVIELVDFFIKTDLHSIIVNKVTQNFPKPWML